MPVIPVPIVVMHTPALHVAPPAHALPQVPQLAGSVSGFTQDAPHINIGNAQGIAQLLDAQVLPSGQRLPQKPQLVESVRVSTHRPAHVAIGGGHVDRHMLPEQIMPAAHRLPHVPQFVGSFVASTHVPPQAICGKMHPGASRTTRSDVTASFPAPSGRASIGTDASASTSETIESVATESARSALGASARTMSGNPVPPIAHAALNVADTSAYARISLVRCT